jgi:hypothetical protein
MNLQAYANHRKALGLRGTSHVAVINAYNDGRLSEPAVRREGRSWIINPELADEQWAARTDPSEYGGHAGGGSRPIGIETPAQQEPAPSSAQSAPPAAKSGPPIAVSKQVKAAYEAKLTELDYKERSREMGSLQDMRKEASRLARQVRDLLLIIPSRNAAKVAAMSDPEEIRALLQAEIESALRGLASA